MSNQISFSEEILERIEELVRQNINPNKISKMIYTEFNEKRVYKTYANKIESIFNKKWDARAKKYIDAVSIQSHTGKYSKVHKDQINMFGIFNVNPEVQPEHNKLQKPPSLKVDNTQLIINHLMTINKNIQHLDSRMKKIEKFIDKFNEENSPNKLKSFREDFIEIYAGSRNKESVNINSEIKKKIIKEMERVYKIRKNQSLAINTALLSALYNSTNKDNDE